MTETPAPTTATRYADPDRCPDCTASLRRPVTACATCGLPLTGEDAAGLFSTLQTADAYLARLRRAAQGATAPVPAPTAPSTPVTWQPTLVVPERTGVSWSVPAVLLALGATCLTVGALVFLAVAWSVLGVGGRTAVLLGFTGVAVAVTVVTARRGLRGAAEAFAALAGLFAALDLAGAYHSGWLGDLGAPAAVLVSGAAIAVLAGAGNLALRGGTRLVAPQLLAVGGLAAAALAAPFTWDAHLTTLVGATIALLLGCAEAGRRSGQLVLAVGAATLAANGWLALVGLGLADGTASWLVAAGYAAGAFALALHRSVAPWAAAPLGVAAYLLVVATIGVELTGTTSEVVVLVAVAALLAAAVSPAARAAAPAAIAGSGVLAGVASLLALGWLVALVEGVADAVASGTELSTRFVPVTTGSTAEPWTVGLAALAVGATFLAVRPLAAGVWAPPAAPPAAATAGIVLLGYTDLLLAAVAVAAVVAALHLGARCIGSGPRWLAWTGATTGTVLAAAVASFHPAPLTAVGAAASLVALGVVLRGATDERPVVATVLAPLVGLTAAAAGWLVGAPLTWAAVATIVVTGLVAVALATRDRGPTRPRDALALGLGSVAALVGMGAAADPGGWATGYLVLLGAVAAALAITRRSLPLSLLATGFQVAALWVRLAVAEVETPEAYTIPLAAVLLVYGAWWGHRDRALGTTQTLLPGLTVGLAPSLVLAVGDPVSQRAALLAVACAVLVAVGATARLRAPFLAGAVTGLVLAVAETAPYADAVPRWVSLGVAGAVLLAAGVRWEHLAGAGRRGWGHVLDLR